MADPSIVQVEDQLVIRPQITLVEGKPVYAKRPAIAYPQGLAPVVEIVIRNSQGLPLNLTSAGFGSADPSSGSSQSSAGGSGEGKLVLRLREVFNFKPNSKPIEADGFAWEAPAGIVRVRMPPSVSETAGIMLAQWGVFDSLGTLVTMYDFHVVIERGQFGKFITDRGLPAVEEVRAWMRDNDPNDNYMLKTLEFDLPEIVESMIDCVRAWNSSHPLIPQKYNTVTFPAPSAMRNGIMGRLYQLAAKHYRRAHLPYSAAGVQIDDKNKSQEYQQMGDQMWKAYEDWVRTDKARINRDNFNGTFGSRYGTTGGAGQA